MRVAVVPGHGDNHYRSFGLGGNIGDSSSMGVSMEVKIHTKVNIDGSTSTRYIVLIDGKEFCKTTNDDDGFNLMVGVNELQYRRDAERTALAWRIATRVRGNE